MKRKWISIKRFKMHEFHTTLRRFKRSENTWERRFEILTLLEEQATQHFMKLCGSIFVSYLLATSLRSENLIEVKIQGFEASIPAAYFLASSGFLFLIGTLSLCHLSVVISLKARESGRFVLSGFSTSIYGLIKGKKDDVSLGITEYSNFFVRQKFPAGSFLGSAFLFAAGATLIPLAGFGVFLFLEQLHLVSRSDISIPQRVSAGFGCLTVLLSFIYAILFHIPLPSKKNTRSVRWSFLASLHTSDHPRAEIWRNKP
ncbi:hypothetical protein [Phaeobacter inhibens]|uniref:hypothetical protein n=1 Tax=Phaeobacter inhibens TaxID=221822 RepID=UPI0021A3EBD6|nr:hypothetical protein [Phaeobacter inhibens]UWR94801.1 hypothetical protein K4K99_10320 [Phaeobacter inhibens]